MNPAGKADSSRGGDRVEIVSETYTMPFCSGCGNEVDDPSRCPICKSGRATKPRRRREAGQHTCPRCEVALEQQDWEGSITWTCPDCRGIFFPERTLEEVLNKLRAAADPVDTRDALKDFRDRFTRRLPEQVRYKHCPACGEIMTRFNYLTVSGVLVDVCGKDGTWVDENAFAELADFICRGGDVVANAADRVRNRTTGTRRESSSNLLDKLFGR